MRRVLIEIDLCLTFFIASRADGFFIVKRGVIGICRAASRRRYVPGRPVGANILRIFTIVRNEFAFKVAIGNQIFGRLILG